jgi:hypothetical protein
MNILSTRFSNSTWNENISYRNKTDIRCIYGSPQEMSPRILYDSVVYIVEMNNSTNKIEGIGMVKNHPCADKYYSIYSDGNYNRFIYKSDYYLDRETIMRYNIVLVEALDYILFKEKNHLKRGIGFTTITQKIINNKNHEKYKLLDIQKIILVIKNCFIQEYRINT